MQEETDEAVAARVQAGDSEAFGVLIERYEAKLKRYGRKFLNSKEDIEDLVQDVFLKTYTNIQSFDTDLRFSPWVYRIAHNEFVNALRKRTRFPRASVDPDTILPFIVAKETTDGSAYEAELRVMIQEALSQLDSKYREPLILFYYEDMTYQDIAEVLRIPPATVGVRIKRAKDKLKAVYDKKVGV